MPALPNDCEATAEHAQRLHAAGLLTDAELAEDEGRLAEIAQDPSGYLAWTRTSTPRSSGSSVRSDARSTRGAHATTRSPLRSVSTSLDACAEAREEIDALALVILSFARRSGHRDARLHASPARSARHARPSSARAGGDARPRPPALCGGRRGAAASPLGAGALAGSTLELRLRPVRCANSIDAVGDRDFALDYLYAAAVIFTHLSRIGEDIVLWATASSASSDSRERGNRARG